MKYNIDAECFYNDTESYQKVLCKCLDVENNDIEKLTECVNNLYKDLKDVEMFKEIYRSIRSNIIIMHDCEDDVCFTFLFGYDTFSMIHKILCEFYKTNVINSDLVSELNLKIRKLI